MFFKDGMYSVTEYSPAFSMDNPYLGYPFLKTGVDILLYKVRDISWIKGVQIQGSVYWDVNYIVLIIGHYIP